MSDIITYVRTDKLLQATLSLLILYNRYYKITNVLVLPLKLIQTHREKVPSDYLRSPFCNEEIKEPVVRFATAETINPKKRYRLN
jgi:hypothetical protein